MTSGGFAIAPKQAGCLGVEVFRAHRAAGRPNYCGHDGFARDALTTAVAIHGHGIDADLPGEPPDRDALGYGNVLVEPHIALLTKMVHAVNHNRSGA